MEGRRYREQEENGGEEVQRTGGEWRGQLDLNIYLLSYCNNVVCVIAV